MLCQARWWITSRTRRCRGLLAQGLLLLLLLLCSYADASAADGACVIGISVPITPAAALKNYANVLTNYEQSEVLEYPQVYFLGEKAKKVKPSLSDINHGYDDDRGDYIITSHDHIQYRYEILEILVPLRREASNT